MARIIEYAWMSNAVYTDDPRVDGWNRGNFRANLGDGLQAAVFNRGEQTIAAFKGTTPSQVGDLVADVKLGVGMNTSYYSQAEQYVARFANVPNLVVTGHSLGGAIAQTVGNRRRIPFVTFNAPGVAIVASQNIATINPVLGAVRVAGGMISLLRHPMQAVRDMRSAFHDSLGINFRLSGDVISQAGLHYGPLYTLPGRGNPLEQHSMDLMVELVGASQTGNVQFP